MKKFFLMAVALVGSFVCANAEESYAPEKGDFSTEIQFAPFESNGNVFSMPALSARYFLTDKDALVLELGLNGRNVKHVGNTEHDESFTKGYYGTFAINLGYQRHVYNYKRADFYVGGKVGYFHDFAGMTVQSDDNNKTWTNYVEFEDGDKYYTSNGIQVYLTGGMDFYVYKGLFLGVELNLGFSDAFAVNTTTKITSNGTETEHKSKVGGHDFVGGFSVDPKLRLGWTF